MMNDKFTAECIWRLEADMLLKARFLSVLEVQSIQFQHVTPLVSRGVWEFEQGEFIQTEIDDISKRPMHKISRDGRILLMKGEVELCGVGYEESPQNYQMRSSQAYAPCLLQYFGSEVELRYAPGSVWLRWYECDEDIVTGSEATAPMTPAEEARMHGISIALGVGARHVSFPRARRRSNSGIPVSPRTLQQTLHYPCVMMRESMPWMTDKPVVVQNQESAKSSDDDEDVDEEVKSNNDGNLNVSPPLSVIVEAHETEVLSRQNSTLLQPTSKPIRLQDIEMQSLQSSSQVYNVIPPSSGISDLPNSQFSYPTPLNSQMAEPPPSDVFMDNPPPLDSRVSLLPSDSQVDSQIDSQIINPSGVDFPAVIASQNQSADPQTDQPNSVLDLSERKE